MGGKSVKKLDITVDPDDLIGGVKSILAQLKPEWELKNIKYKVFTEGISNQLVGCFHPCEPPGLLVRVYGVGTDLFIDRKAEQKTMVTLAQAGLGPDLIATFCNGLVYYFVPGSVLTVENVSSGRLWQLVARRLGAMHRLPTESEKPALWPRIRHFLQLIPDYIFTDSKFAKIKLLFSGKKALTSEVSWLEAQLQNTASPVVFCHNDLLLANVVVDDSESDVTFIDYEYSADSYQAYDIANHFNEYAGVDSVDYSRIPPLEYQRKWVREYLTSYLQLPPSEEQVTQTLNQVQQFMCTSHLLWGLWSLVQSLHSKIDFDFIDYAAIRLEQYEKVRCFVTEFK